MLIHALAEVLRIRGAGGGGVPGGRAGGGLVETGVHGRSRSGGLLLLLLSRGRRRRATAGQEVADGVADGGTDGDTTMKNTLAVVEQKKKRFYMVGTYAAVEAICENRPGPELCC